MEDNSGKTKVAWSIGKGKIPDGPDFSNTTGTIYLDSLGWEKKPVAKGSSGPGVTFDLVKQPEYVATIVVIRALPEDNGGADIYKYLTYKFGEERDKTEFGESPLMLIGSVAKLVVGKYPHITIWYDPDQADKSTEGVAKATTPQPPKEATITVHVGVSVIKMTQTGSPTSS